MKREILKLAAGTLLAAVFSAGCAHRVVVREHVAAAPPSEVIISTERPPESRHEVIGVAPGPHHVWIEGYWVRTNGRWVWVKGHYELGPRPGAVWVKGHWDQTDHGWVWVKGHWA